MAGTFTQTLYTFHIGRTLPVELHTLSHFSAFTLHFSSIPAARCSLDNLIIAVITSTRSCLSYHNQSQPLPDCRQRKRSAVTANDEWLVKRLRFTRTVRISTIKDSVIHRQQTGICMEWKIRIRYIPHEASLCTHSTSPPRPRFPSLLQPESLNALHHTAE